MAGYSGTPLPQKLGIKEGMILGILDAPDSFAPTLGRLPADVAVHHDLAPANIFNRLRPVGRRARQGLPQCGGPTPPDGTIWVAWPKRSSGVETNVTEDTLRHLFLRTGMVDNKVCAIDNTWSGLRFVVRKENRATWPSSTIRA